MALPTLSVCLLGGFQVYCGETVLSDRFKPRLQTFLAYLVRHREPPLSRQQLAFHFWPDSTDAQARANLRKSIYRLRRAFPDADDYLQLEGATIGWREGAPLRVDVAQFEETLQLAEAVEGERRVVLLEESVACYKGDLLPDRYDDWLLAWRERLRQRYLSALSLLAQQHEARRAFAAAIETTRVLLQQDPVHEETYRRLMRLQALSGDVAGALRTYHRCARELEQELGVEPGESTRRAYRRLLDRRDRPEPAPDFRAPGPLPLVGRQKAWQRLLDVWRRARAGRAQVVVIFGEAGIGKTRLAEALLSWTARQGIPTLTAACFATESPLPLRPVADWLRSEAVGRALPALAPRWRSELARVLPELAAADPALPLPRPMTESWQRQHFFMALAEAVRAAGEPVLLFLDDLHWADAETLDWLQFLAQQNSGYRFLLVGTVRSEEVASGHPLPSWQEGLARLLPVHPIVLARLSQADTASLAASLLGRSLPEESAASLHRETEGNPLFTVEMVRAGLSHDEAPLPEKVRSVIELRLRRLSRPAQDVAALAAVIGRRFAFPLLRAASPQSEGELLDGLDELWQRQVIREQGEDAYDFSHDLIRQVTLGRLSPARRQWWHRQVAEALEQLAAGNLEGVHGRLAAHREAAGQPAQAVACYLQGAQTAFRLYAHKQALAHLRRAQALLPAGDGRHADIYAQMGEAQMALGRFEAAATAFQEAAKEAGDVEQMARLQARRILALDGCRRFEEARDAYEEALSLLELTPPGEWRPGKWRVWIDLHLSLLDLLYFANKPEQMAETCEVMAGPVEAHGTLRQRAQYLTSVSRVRFQMLRYRLTDREVAERQAALQWGRETEDDYVIAENQFGFGFALLWAGHPASALGELAEAAARAEAVGNVPLQSRSLTYLGIAQRMMGDEAGVRETVEKLVPAATAEGNRFYLGVAEALRAWLQWRAGEMEATEMHARTALQQWEMRRVPYPMQWLARLPLLAVAFARGEVTAAAQGQARAMVRAPQQQLPDALAEALEAVVAADSPPALVGAVQEVCRLAEAHGYL